MDNCIVILVALILASSYLFKVKWTNPNTQQLLYVFAGLFLIIIMQKYYLTDTENFENNTPSNNITNENENKSSHNWENISTVTSDNFKGLKQIMGYLKGLSEEDINKEETQRLIASLTSKFNKFEPSQLDNQLTQITTLLQNLQNVSGLTGVPDSKDAKEENILESRSINESQFLQDIEIKNLEREINELQKIYNGYQEKEAKKNYKKIPVYSSCVMEANGSTTKCNTGPSEIGFETEQQQNQKLKLTGMDVKEEEDPTNNAIQKLIKSIAEGGISVNMTRKSKVDSQTGDSNTMVTV